MFRFLPGIIIAQAASVALVLLFADTLSGWGWLKAGVIMLVIGLLVAAWFVAIARHLNRDELACSEARFAREREKLLVKAEREKARVVQQSHRKIVKEARRANSKANMKVGMSLAGVAAAGALLLFTQFLTVGLLAISAAGGGLAGYLTRVRQEKSGTAQVGVAGADAPRLSGGAAPPRRRFALPSLRREGGKS